MNLLLKPQESFLLATIAGTVTLNEAIEVYKRIVDAAVERGLDKILVDCFAAEGGLSNLEKYELGKSMAEHCQGLSLKIATIGTLPTMDGFAALVARNRGLVAEKFSERQAALDWLNAFGSGATVS